MSVTAPEHHPHHVVAVTGIVTDGGDRVLLVKGDRRGWEPPLSHPPGMMHGDFLRGRESSRPFDPCPVLDV